MKIAKFKTMLNECGLPELVNEQEYDYSKSNFNTPELIAEMMKDVFVIHKNTEEYLFEVCFNMKMKPIAVFEISHGTISMTVVSPREVFQKALICGAANVAIVHNHPSGDCSPSRDDDLLVERLEESGKMIGVPIVDSIIVGDQIYSYRENGRMKEAF